MTQYSCAYAFGANTLIMRIAKLKPIDLGIRLLPTLRRLLIEYDTEVVTMGASGPLVKRQEKPQRLHGPSLACNQRTPHLLGGFARWRRGREAEGGGLLNRYTL